MKVLLVRHGESSANVDTNVHRTMADHAIPLSAKGHKEAKLAGKAICDHLDEWWATLALPAKLWLWAVRQWRLLRRGKLQAAPWLPQVRLWNSPYKRTRQTADGVEHSFRWPWGYDRREHALLCEQQFGMFDGISDDELPKVFPHEHAHYDKCERFGGRFWARMPLGESRFDVAMRVHQAFGTFHRDADRHGIDVIVVVCHGVTQRAFRMMWLHHTPEWFERERNPPNCSVYLIEGSTDGGYIFIPGDQNPSAWESVRRASGVGA